MRCHGGEAGIDDAGLAFLDLVDRSLHVVVDATARHTAQSGKRARVRIEKHFVALCWIRLHHERPAEAKLQMRRHDLAPDATNNQMLFAPVELMRVPRFELQWHEGAHCRLPMAGVPGTNKIGD